MDDDVVSPHDSELPGMPDDAAAGSPPADPLVGRVLADRYRILSKLGEGAMGTVYLGEHLRMGRRDAIKVLRGGLAQDTEAAARFTRGARNVSAIRHSNVCAIYDFSNTEEGLQYLAMEYIEGETLRDAMERETRLDIGRAVDIACQVADALQAAHDAGVVHRDLKPGNIMLCPRAVGEVVKVVDFDIAKGPGEPEGQEVTRVGFVVGTPEYMSPEQLTGDRLDGRSDLYSLGVVLYRMITGVLPFRAVSTQEIMVQRLTTDALRISDTLPEGTFPALETVLARSLARNADLRQPSAAVFARELRSALSADAPAVAHTAAAPDLPPTRVARAVSAGPLVGGAPKSKVSRGLMVGGALAAVAVVVIGASALLRDRAPDPTDGVPVAVNDSSAVAADPAGDVSPDDTVAGNGMGDHQADSSATPVADGSTVESDRELAATRRDTLLIYRQLDTLDDGPSLGQALAARDTALLVWSAAVTRSDSTLAALALARSALSLESYTECADWARRGAALDNDDLTENTIWTTLLQVCR
jgi:serine/threonine-protein kinase